MFARQASKGLDEAPLHTVGSSPLTFFLMYEHFVKSLLNLLQYCFNKQLLQLLTILFWVFSLEACRIFAPPSGIEPTPSALEGEALSTGSPGKCLP